LSHRNGTAWQVQLLRQINDVIGWIRAHRQEADEGRPLLRLGPHSLHIEHNALRIRHSQRLGNVLARHRQRAIRTKAAHQEQLLESVQDIGIALGELLLLGRVRVKPSLPRLVVVGNLAQDLREVRQLAQLHQIQPGHVSDPLLGLRLHRIQVQGSAALDEHLEGIKFITYP